MTYKKCNIMREDEDKTCKTVVTLGSDIDDVEIHIIRDASDGEWKKAYKKIRKQILRLLEDIRDKETDYYKDETAIYAGISAIEDNMSYVIRNNGIDDEETI